jgi:hypothetical protein
MPEAKVKPTFAPDQDMMNVSPADVADAKRRTKETTAYDKANTIPMAPKPEASAPVKRMAKGGSASSRADGIAQRGKTRGTVC